MAIRIKVGEEDSVAPSEGLTVRVGEQQAPEPTLQISLQARKTLDGHIMIFDHKDIDIVMMPKENKIVAFPKESMGTHVYEVQDRLFKFLFKKELLF